MANIFSAITDRPRFVDVRRADIPDELRGLCEYYGEDMCALLCVNDTPPSRLVHMTIANPIPGGTVIGFPGSNKDLVERWLAEQRDKKSNKDALQFWAEIAILAFVGIEMTLSILSAFRGNPVH